MREKVVILGIVGWAVEEKCGSTPNNQKAQEVG